jgi:hypothetical protein
MDIEENALPHNPHTDVEGMTLLDYFAAAALQGLLANPEFAPEMLKRRNAMGGWFEEQAWDLAESMMKIRSETYF